MEASHPPVMLSLAWLQSRDHWPPQATRYLLYLLRQNRFWQCSKVDFAARATYEHILTAFEPLLDPTEYFSDRHRVLLRKRLRYKIDRLRAKLVASNELTAGPGGFELHPGPTLAALETSQSRPVSPVGNADNPEQPSLARQTVSQEPSTLRHLLATMDIRQCVLEVNHFLLTRLLGNVERQAHTPVPV